MELQSSEMNHIFQMNLKAVLQILNVMRYDAAKIYSVGNLQ